MADILVVRMVGLTVVRMVYPKVEELVDCWDMTMVAMTVDWWVAWTVAWTVVHLAYSKVENLVENLVDCWVVMMVE